jgi:hypothetical protein
MHPIQIIASIAAVVSAIAAVASVYLNYTLAESKKDTTPTNSVQEVFRRSDKDR